MTLREKLDTFLSLNLSDSDDGRLLRELLFHPDCDVKIKVLARKLMLDQRPELQNQYKELFRTPERE